MNPLEIALAVQSLLLALCLFRWLAGRKEVRFVEEADYKDGRARTFVRAKLVSDGTVGGGGTFLADGATGRPLQFTGVTSAQVHYYLTAGGKRGKVAVLLDGLEIERA